MGWPLNVGIRNFEVYIPKYYVSQDKLEIHDKVGTGKYTIGLGQKKMGFCSDLEDINSLCLTVVHNLLENHKIDPSTVGRLEVGTETILDKSKSVKTVLMQLFGDNTDIEGIDTTNACYGGTSALFNAINWVESSSWDGRLAIVVAADIAVYAEGNARCTGGGGAIAMVIGPDAPIVFDRGLKATHMAHVYDFYKPNLSSEYPTINGKLSVDSYTSSMDTCYDRYARKFVDKGLSDTFSLANIPYFVFHTPYCKLVQKSLSRCMLNDYLNHKNNNAGLYPQLDELDGLTLEKTFQDAALFKKVEKACVGYSQQAFKEKTEVSTELANLVGNMYTPSLYGSLVSLLMNTNVDDLVGKRVALFSYGSGLAASMFSLTMCPDLSKKEKFGKLVSSLKSLRARLDQRIDVEPARFVEILTLREKSHNACDFVPVCDPQDLFVGTYYLTKIDEKYRRSYSRK